MNMGNRSFKLKCENLAAISGRIRLRYRGICHITSHYNQLMEDIYDVYYVIYYIYYFINFYIFTAVIFY